MAPAKLHRTGQAEEDLIDIWVHIARDNPAAADRVLDRFEERWALLATQPRSGVARPDLAEGIRQVVVGSYLTLYRVKDGTVVILRVLHGHRRIEADDIGI